MAENGTPEHHSITAGKVTIPGTKVKVPKIAAGIGVAVVAVLAIMYYRNKKAKAAAPGTTVTDPDGNVCAALAPSGFCPGTPGDLNAQAQGSGAGGFGGGFGGGTTDTPVGTQVQNGPPFTTNAAWSQYVISQLSQTVDPAALTNAIGEYLAGAQVTTAQEQLIRDAIAVGNTPPVAGTNGFPPSINVGGSKTGGGQVPPRPSDLALDLEGPTTIVATWRPSAHASSYMFQVTPHDPAPHNIGDRTDYSAGGLEHGKTYTVHVAAENANGTSSYVTKTIKTGVAPKPPVPPRVIPGGPEIPAPARR